MSHEITKTAAGIFLCAYRGEQPWHAAETKPIMVADSESDAVLLAHAGYNARIRRAKLRFPLTPEAAHDPAQWRELPDLQVFLSNATGEWAPIGTGSPSFQIVKPTEAADFIQRVARTIDGRVVGAGTLHSGRGMFASIEAGESVRVVGSDVIKSHMTFSTYNDGTDPTRLTATEFRVECNNMLRMALAKHGQSAADFTLSHRLEFDPARLAAYWSARLADHRIQIERMKMLAQTPMQLATGERFVFDLFNDRRSESAKQAPDAPVGAGKRDIRNSNGYRMVLGLFNGAGRGANLPGVKGTAWGMLNAVSEYVDHHAQASSASHRWDSAMFGRGAQLKQTAFDRLLSLAMAE